MIINSCKDEMKLWNGLPAILIPEKGKREWAVFSKAGNEIIIGKVLEEEFNSQEIYEKAKRVKGIDNYERKNSGKDDCTDAD